MKLNKKSKTKINLALSVCFAQLNFGIVWASPMPNSSEIKKYFNPIHEKSYLNEKQDRIIKKKSFKTQELENISPITNRDIGLFAILAPSKFQDTNYIDHLLDNNDVNGISCLMPWRSLEPSEDVFDWKIVDELLSLCAKHHKQLILRISTYGFDLLPETAKSDTPEWVYKAGTPSLVYADKNNISHLMPISWDGTYLAKWSNFVNELGRKYDKNPHFQSIGITGGGTLGGTKVVPEFTGNKENYEKLENELKEKHGMNSVQIVTHWKYVADIFPKAFPDQHLNFNIDPPTPNRKGQDCLDEISDYLVYRYGQRVYVTRQNMKNDKRGFDDYRLLLKFKNDTPSGYQFSPDLTAADLQPFLPKIAKNAFDDGISFVELPSEIFNSTDETIKQWLTQMRLHLGYQLILQEFTLPATVAGGKTMPVHFTFLNTGSASPKRSAREMDKAIPSSYKIQLELKDGQGKTKALLRHTPGVSTVDWLGLKPISWDQNLKLPPLKPGKYNVHLAIIDDQTNRKLNYCQAIPGKSQETGNDLLVGTLDISAN